MRWSAQEHEGELPAGVRAYVLLNEDEAWYLTLKTSSA
jgi:hypothetical protein